MLAGFLLPNLGLLDTSNITCKKLLSLAEGEAEKFNDLNTLYPMEEDEQIRSLIKALQNPKNSFVTIMNEHDAAIKRLIADHNRSRTKRPSSPNGLTLGSSLPPGGYNPRLTGATPQRAPTSTTLMGVRRFST